MAVRNKLIRKDWLPEAKMQRVIFHWTAGGPTASNEDRQHYHFIIENSGKVVRGHHSVDANENTADRVYAAHTRMCNTGSIGVAACGMADSRERPFDPGPYPITHGQYEVCCRIIAELCINYQIPVSPQTVLNHGEVENLLGIRQRGKWDVMALPWKPHLGPQEVGKYFRSRVNYYYGELVKNAWEGPTSESISHPVKEEPASSGPLGKGVVTARSGLNVRVGPGPFYPKAGKPLRYGSEVVVLKEAEGGTWYETVDGFVFAKYVDLIESFEPLG